MPAQVKLASPGNRQAAVPEALDLVDQTDRPFGILLADDEESICTILSRAFHREGWRVFITSNGVQSVQLFNTYHSDIDLALLDVGLPCLDGVQTLRHLRSYKPGLPCCFITAGSRTWTGEQLLSLGNTQLLWKPFDLEDILHVVGLCRNTCSS